MVDIHCHPLPEVDDGARSFEMAVAMCRMAAADGITHLVATPHCNYEYEFEPEVNRAKLAELQGAVGEKPQLLLGCDFHLSYDNIRLLLENHAEYTLNRTSYVLVEFGEQFIPDQLANVLYEIQLAGLIPIITHPERNAVFIRRPQLLYDWVTKGCLVQITAKSYTGGFGHSPRHFAELWLEQNLVHFFASDAHDLKYRPPVLSECYDKLVLARGREEALRLLETNPEAVITGMIVPPGPQAVPAREIKRKRSWFSFLRR